MSLRPLLVLVDRIDAETDDLDAALVELRLQLRHVTELGRADRREVLRMRKQHRPGVANPLMEIDEPLGRLRLEIRRLISDSNRHGSYSSTERME